MTQQEALPLRVVLGALGLFALFSQALLVPREAGEYAAAYPSAAYLAVPYAVAVVAAIACFEVALLAAWQILTAAVADAAPGSTTPKWANVVAVSLSLTGVILAGICAHAGSVAGVGGPAMLLGVLAGLGLVPAAFALRARLRRLSSGPAPGNHGLIRGS